MVTLYTAMVEWQTRISLHIFCLPWGKKSWESWSSNILDKGLQLDTQISGTAAVPLILCNFEEPSHSTTNTEALGKFTEKIKYFQKHKARL